MGSRLMFTSESVSMGHPDKMCDQISDAILDAMLAQDPASRVACETATTTGLVLVCGEVTTAAQVEIPSIVRSVVHLFIYGGNFYRSAFARINLYLLSVMAVLSLERIL